MPLTGKMERTEKKSTSYQHNCGTMNHDQLNDPLQDPLLVANAEQGIQAAGGALPFADRIAASFGDHDVSGIRAHAGGDAADACRTMGARAYATGNHVAFAGAPDLHTAAHEAAHVVQQRAGVSLKGGVGQAGDAYERQADEVADAVVAGRSAAHLLGPVKSGDPAVGQVQHKLGGTAKAMEEAGGESGKYATKFGLSTYQNILGKLRKYEDLEASLVGKELSERDKDKLTKSLTEIENLAEKWMNNHHDIHEFSVPTEDIDGGTLKGQAVIMELSKRRSEHIKASKHGERDYDRAQQLRLLLPRLRLEKQDITSGRFERETIRSDKTEQKDQGRDRVIGGVMNMLDKVHYQGETESSYFKEDAPLDFSRVGVMYDYNIGRRGEKTGGPTNSTGLEKVNLGSRSVASSRLDEKLSGDTGERLVAHTEFATHTRTGIDGGPDKTLMGTSQKIAKGRSGANVSQSDQLRQGESQPGDIDLNDPELQRMLSNLQVLDAICGQLDRHAGNFIIDSDVNGRVQSVTGIDLDLAFGSNHKDINQKPSSGHFKGLPIAVDKSFAERVLALTADDLTDILSPLLEKSEVEAAKLRLQQVQDALRERQLNNTLVEKWGKETAKSMLGDVTPQQEAKNYLASMRTVAISQALSHGRPEDGSELTCYKDHVEAPVRKAFHLHPTSPPSLARNLALFAKDIATHDKAVLMAESMLKQKGEQEMFRPFYKAKWQWVGTQVQNALDMALTGDETDPKWSNFKFPSVSKPENFLEFI